MAIAVAFAVAACAPTAELRPADLLGRPLDVLSSAAGAEVQLILQDASPRVGLDASYRFGSGADSEWVVVAACSSEPNVLDPGTVEVAVIPSAAVTAGIEAEIGAGEWSDAIGCEGRPNRG